MSLREGSRTVFAREAPNDKQERPRIEPNVRFLVSVVVIAPGWDRVGKALLLDDLTASLASSERGVRDAKGASGGAYGEVGISFREWTV